MHASGVLIIGELCVILSFKDFEILEFAGSRVH